MIYVCADICFLASLLCRQPNPSAARRGGPRRGCGNEDNVTSAPSSSLPGCLQLRPVRGGQGVSVCILKSNQREQREKLLIAVLAKFREGLSCQAAKLQEKSFLWV